MELGVKIGLSCGVDHHGNRPKVVAVERVCEIDPGWRDIGPRAADGDRRGLGFHGNGRGTTEEAKSNGERANNLAHRHFYHKSKARNYEARDREPTHFMQRYLTFGALVFISAIAYGTLGRSGLPYAIYFKLSPWLGHPNMRTFA